MKLQEYDMEVFHRKGRIHRNADYMSREAATDSDCNVIVKTISLLAERTDSQVLGKLWDEVCWEDINEQYEVHESRTQGRKIVSVKMLAEVNEDENWMDGGVVALLKNRLVPDTWESTEPILAEDIKAAQEADPMFKWFNKEALEREFPKHPRKAAWVSARLERIYRDNNGIWCYAEQGKDPEKVNSTILMPQSLTMTLMRNLHEGNFAEPSFSAIHARKAPSKLHLA